MGHKDKKTVDSEEKQKAYPPFIEMLVRFNKAYKARVAEEGGNAKAQFAVKRKALLRETQVETTLRSKFQEEVQKLVAGKTESFTFKIKPEIYPYFDILKKGKEYSSLDILALGDFTYKVQLKSDLILDEELIL